MKGLLAFLILFLSFSLINIIQSQTDLSAGLKEALNVATNNSVTKANQQDGYFKNPKIKIPFPQDADFVKNTVKEVPIEGPKLVNDFEEKLNRSAEKSAMKAKPILIDAITKMTITDATNIMTGGDNAATQYLKKQSYNDLIKAFKPERLCCMVINIRLLNKRVKA